MGNEQWWGGSEDRTLSETVVFEVAALEGVDPLDLPPLFEAVDPESLDGLFSGRPSSYPGKPGDSHLTVRFVYHGYGITASNDGTLLVERLGAERDGSAHRAELRAEEVPTERLYGLDSSSRE
ncbi:HalOD1 output domain-containing protein [Natronorarus salvus]|uniref:HalOD1 output domain-containing protein n=1 Tax=Natronorarus salvus TaxID=3117733 RepID=UPI002F263851